MSSFTPVLLFVAFRVAASGSSALGILASMNIQFVVIDPDGLRTGRDPATGIDLSEIPWSEYGVKATGETESANGDRSRYLVVGTGSGGQLKDGAYIFRVYGEKPGPFWLSISVYREPVSEDFNIKGTIRSGGAREYRLHFAGDLSVPIKIDTLGSK